MPRYVKIEFAADDVIQVESGQQNGFLVIHEPGQQLAVVQEWWLG